MIIRKKYKSTSLALFIIIELFFLMSVNPFTSPAFNLFLGIVFIVVDYYLLVSYVISYLSKEFMSIKIRRKKLIITLSSVGGLLIMLESLGQLTFKDIIVIIVLAVIIYLYTWYIMERNDHY